MQIVRLGRGKRASDNENRVIVSLLPDGQAGWAGAVIVAGMAVYGLCKHEFPSVEEAEADAIKRARVHGIAKIMIEIH